ncbi:TIGR03364 family FAD-dependent oxidoreductase [Cyclobacterium amurskyense]|uniref:Putative secreted oxidoreductase n=1 Tax=Cyclobacterium amurskyense TaxID=320787 RepID=A0A0H4P976_9BACT|nr:TIGR03364 family FAD-dependent oxidoreductase [Cyclobacterium amurskyense]AKP49685.1 Putative secreted oxidoreductase [Cyclobacterium amurskyense]|tara:strand:- start:3079 stop:4230 length:1152 start_codon:yes stop_codon:yes gene_type:complete
MFDLIVVGAGVLGTFHAYHALKKGLKVALIEKDNAPQGATVRNFGQVIPSGMNEKWQAYGRESLAIYKEIHSTIDLTVRNQGTVYLASDAEEMQLIEELASINYSRSYPSILLSKPTCLGNFPGLRSDYVKGGLFFPEEITVEPRLMIHRLLNFMHAKMGLAYLPSTTVIACENNGSFVRCTTTSGKKLKSSKVLICSGSEFKTLYPAIFAGSDMEISKLQMMQTKPQAKSYQLPGSLLTGRSIRRYEAFQECPSYASIKKKEANDTLEKKWGIHILFKQAMDGSVILGDSHQYTDARNSDKLGFDLDMEIDQFMLQEAKAIIDLPTYDIAYRWYGTYAQCKNGELYEKTIDENIHIVTGIGGKGMTGSPAFAKENIEKLFNL